MTKLRVWHVPQVPMKPFQVPVSSVEEGVKVMDVLADYDLFQLENYIKPDYANANGLEMWDDTLTDQDLLEMKLKDRWVDWYNDEYDDPRSYLEDLESKEGLLS